MEAGGQTQDIKSGRSLQDLHALRMWDRVVSRPLSRVACGRPIRHAGRYGVVVETALGELVRFENGVRVRWTDGREDTLSALIEVDTPVGAS